MTSAGNASGDGDVEHLPKEALIIHTPLIDIIMKDYTPLWEQHIHYNAAPAPYITRPTDSFGTSSQSSQVPLALPALPSTSAAPAGNLDTGTGTQPTSTANMVIPSKEIASTTLILSRGIV
uniref:Uncharacterized protein n=1 Tax=Romanomermis culicivorax TaxID=13658 RepID=A0A915JKV6_ROMCU